MGSVHFENRAEIERKELEKKIERERENQYVSQQNESSQQYELESNFYEEIKNEDYKDNDYIEDDNINEKIQKNTSYNDTKNFSTKLTSFFKKIASSNMPKVFLSIVGVVAFIALLFVLFSPKEETLNITGFSWESSISIEEYKTVEESGWSLPSGGRLLYTKEEISHYEQVFDHYETKTKTVSRQEIVDYEEKIRYVDLGNGYFEEVVDSVPVYDTVYEEVEYQEAVYKDVPVYKTKYYYEIDKWVYKETVSETGNDKNPYYPDVTFSDNERESSRNQQYFVTGTNEKGKNLTLSLSHEDWLNIKTSQTVKFKVYIDNSAKVIDIEE